MTTNRTPWGREIAEARTPNPWLARMRPAAEADQPDTIRTPWGRTMELTEDQKRQRHEREMREVWAKQAEAKRKAEQAKPTGGKVTILTDNPERVRKQIAEMREVFGRVS